MTTHNINRKINATLDRLERSSGLTREGRDWLIAACDPFHDNDIALAGYPDVLTASTVVQLVKQQVQLTVPTTGPGTVASPNNWDCSIVICPNLTSSQLAYTTTIGNTGLYGTSSGGTFPTIGALSISAGPQGSNLWPVGAITSVPATSTSLGPTAYVKGQGRVIGMAFEVVNTTAEIYKQGQVTAWRLPSKWTPNTAYGTFATTPGVVVQMQYLENRMPPANIAQAQLLFGSRSWAASEGAYVVARQNSEANPALLPTYAFQGYSTADGASSASDTVDSINPFGAPVGSVADYYLPYDYSGVHFTGLSFQTSLTVNVRWLIERIPGPYETDLVVLATPSAPYDPLALELYCSCLRDMPPGVMLKENPLGEWFANALGKLADAAPVIGKALGNFIPGASAIGKVVGMASGGISQAINASSKKNKRGDAANQPMNIPKPPPLPGSRSIVPKTQSYK